LDLKKEKGKPKKNETKTYVLQVEDSINIPNTSLQDLPHPGRGKKGLEDFLLNLGKTLIKWIALNSTYTPVKPLQTS
jgi:hypothetical protein